MVLTQAGGTTARSRVPYHILSHVSEAFQNAWVVSSSQQVCTIPPDQIGEQDWAAHYQVSTRGDADGCQDLLRDSSNTANLKDTDITHATLQR